MAPLEELLVAPEPVELASLQHMPVPPRPAIRTTARQKLPLGRALEV